MDEWMKWSFKGGELWTDWQPLSAEVIGKLPETPGVYVIGLPAKRPLARLLAKDPHNIIDIGESGNLRNRLRDFLRCAKNEGARGQMAAWRLGSGGLLARLNLEPEELLVSFCPMATKEDAYRGEGVMLRRYYELFGELPPLNYKFNWTAWEET